jgi:hypothetical protein
MNTSEQFDGVTRSVSRCEKGLIKEAEAVAEVGLLVNEENCGGAIRLAEGRAGAGADNS